MAAFRVVTHLGALSRSSSLIMDMIGAGKELGIAPSEGVDVVSGSFPSFNEPRFIKPVGL